MLLVDFSVASLGFEAACLKGDFDVDFLPLLKALLRAFFETAAAS